MQKGDEVVVKIKIVWQNVFKISEEITTPRNYKQIDYVHILTTHSSGKYM